MATTEILDYGGVCGTLMKKWRPWSVLSENTFFFLLVILARVLQCFEKYFHLCCVRSVCWTPDSSWRLSKHSHYNAPTVSGLCVKNINTRSKGHFKERGRPCLRFLRYKLDSNLLKRQRRHRSTMTETGGAARWLAVNNSTSSHETLFLHIWKRADGGGFSSFLLLSTLHLQSVRQMIHREDEMFLGDIPDRAGHANSYYSRCRLSPSSLVSPHGVWMARQFVEWLHMDHNGVLAFGGVISHHLVCTDCYVSASV